MTAVLSDATIDGDAMTGTANGWLGFTGTQRGSRVRTD
jgi:hypothetical protein